MRLAASRPLLLTWTTTMDVMWLDSTQFKLISISLHLKSSSTSSWEREISCHTGPIACGSTYIINDSLLGLAFRGPTCDQSSTLASLLARACVNSYQVEYQLLRLYSNFTEVTQVRVIRNCISLNPHTITTNKNCHSLNREPCGARVKALVVMK